MRILLTVAILIFGFAASASACRVHVLAVQPVEVACTSIGTHSGDAMCDCGQASIVVRPLTCAQVRRLERQQLRACRKAQRLAARQARQTAHCCAVALVPVVMAVGEVMACPCE